MKKELKLEKETNPNAIRDIESRRFFERSSEEINSEHEEMLEALFDLLKRGVVKLRVRHNKEKGLWVGEIYFIDTGGVWYSTDFPNDVQNLIDVVLKNGYEPEYVEE